MSNRALVAIGFASLLGCGQIPWRQRPPERSTTLDVLAVAAEYYLRTDPKGYRFFVDDTLTARAFDRTAARGDYTILPQGTRTSCDSSMEIRGTLVRLRLQELSGDSAKVFWSAICHMTPARESEPIPFGAMGPLELVRSNGRWRALPATTFFEL